MRPIVIAAGVTAVVSAIAVPLACSTRSVSGGSSAGTPPGSSAGGGAAGAGSSPTLPASSDGCPGASVPADQAYFPPGWCASIVATVPIDPYGGLRQITFAPNGDILAATTDGTIHLFHDDNADSVYQPSERHSWAETGGNGNNAHLDVASGYVYAGSNDGVVRFKYTAGQPTGGPLEPVVVSQPQGGHHFHTTHVYDGFLYVHSGSSNNVSHESGLTTPTYDTKRSLIKRFDLSKLAPTVPPTPFDWDAGEAFTVGLRNANGFKRNEITKKIYAVVNGLDDIAYPSSADDVHNDNPGEQVVEIAAGKQYGYPFCFTAQRAFTSSVGGKLIPPGTQLHDTLFANPHDDAWCAANSSPPTTFIQAHSAPLDIVFFDVQPKGALPENYRGGAFVALHGAWDRSPLTGYRVVWIPFNPDGTAPMPTSTNDTTTFPYEIVFGAGNASGPTDGVFKISASGVTELPRPAGVAISPIDGALFVTSDAGDVLYRLAMKK